MMKYILLITLLLTGSHRAAHAGARTPPAPTVSQQKMVQAALEGEIEVIKTALQQGYDPNARDAANRTALMYAAFNGQTEVAKALLRAKAHVNAQDGTGTSALMFAASAPHGTTTVQLLLKHGAQIDMIDSNEHFTALMWAAAEGQLETVKLLLKHNADLTLKDVDGDTAESFAAQRGNQAIVDLLKAAAAQQTTRQK